MRHAVPPLTRRRDYLATAAARLSCGTEGFVLQARLHQTPEQFVLPPLRLGITASKKTGPSVTRSRAKRRLRALAAAVLAPQRSLLQPLRPADLVLIARPQIVDLPFARLEKDLRYALARLGILPKRPPPGPAALSQPSSPPDATSSSAG